MIHLTQNITMLLYFCELRSVHMTV